MVLRRRHHGTRWASITITLEIYSHVMPGMHADAAELVAGLILGTGNAVGDSQADGDDVPVTNL